MPHPKIEKSRRKVQEPRGKLKKPPAAATARAHLQKLVSSYGSAARLAKALRPYPRFERISRASIGRWLDDAHTLPRRALAAIELLNGFGATRRLRVAEPRFVWALPSALLSWNDKNVEAWLAQEGITLQPVPVETGFDALHRLQQGDVDVALAAPELVAAGAWGDDCVRLCGLARGFLVGFSVEHKVSSIADVPKCTWGVRRGAPAESILEDIAKRTDKTMNVIPFDSPIGCAESLTKQEINAVVGAEPFITQVKRLVGDSPDTYPVAPTLFRSIDTHVIVNRAVVDPGAVRGYLALLLRSASYVEENKGSDALQMAVASHYHMERREVREVLRSSTFNVDQLAPSMILHLWRRDSMQHPR